MTEEKTIKKLKKEIKELRLQRVKGEKFLGPNWGVPIIAIGFAILFWVNDVAGVIITVVGFIIEYRLRKLKKEAQLLIKNIDQKIKRKSKRILELKNPG
jgi:hypothetical protein